jgi:hypothetical protein
VALSSPPFGRWAARRALLLGTLALGAGCLRQPNPAFIVDLNRDAARPGDVAGLEVRSDAVVEAPAPVIEPPGMDAATVPADPPPVEPRPDAGPDVGKDVAPEVPSPPDVPSARDVPSPPDVPSAPAVSVNKPIYGVGEAVVVSFSNGPGNFADWIGIYDESAGTPSDDMRSRLWYFTDNKGWDSRGAGAGPKSGTVTFSAGSMGSSKWPLPAGRYKAIFLADPHTVLAGPAHFEVR